MQLQCAGMGFWSRRCVAVVVLSMATLSCSSTKDSGASTELQPVDTVRTNAANGTPATFGVPATIGGLKITASDPVVGTDGSGPWLTLNVARREPVTGRRTNPSVRTPLLRQFVGWKLAGDVDLQAGGAGASRCVQRGHHQLADAGRRAARRTETVVCYAGDRRRHAPHLRQRGRRPASPEARRVGRAGRARRANERGPAIDVNGRRTDGSLFSRLTWGGSCRRRRARRTGGATRRSPPMPAATAAPS